MTQSEPTGGTDSTRDRLLKAGLRIFGECGYNGTSTRAIATEADANLAAIPYHFGGKEGLYLAVAEDIAGRIGEFLLPVVSEVEASLDALDDREAQRDALHRLIRRFAQMVIFNPETELWAALIQREQARPTAAFEILYGHFMQRMSRLIDTLIGRLIGRAPDDPRTVLLATTMIGQIMIFRTARAAALRRLGWQAYDADKQAPIIETILRNVDACLDAREGDAS